MEALNVAVLPGATRLNVEGFDLILTEPSLDFTGDKRCAIIASDMLRDTVWLIACQSAAKTCPDRIWRSTRMARHCRVYSSSIVSILSVLPLAVRSKMKSQFQTWSRWVACVGKPVETPCRGRRLGVGWTLRPSFRRIRWTYLRLTEQPSRVNSAQIRR